MKKEKRSFGKILMVLTLIFFYLPIVYMVIFSFNERKVADQFFGIFSALVPAYDGIAHDDGVSVYDIQYCPDRNGDLYGCGYDLGDRPVKVKENRAESDGTGQ